MHFNLFSPDFWALGMWQGIGVVVSVMSLFVSPLLSMVVERIFGKKEGQEDVNAYKAIVLPDTGLTLGEAIVFLPFQSLASYVLFILLQRVLVPGQYDVSTLRVFSAGAIFLVTWGLCSVRRKSLAKLLTWHLCLAMVVFCLLLIGWTWHKGSNSYLPTDFSFVKHLAGQYLPRDFKQLPLVMWLRNIPLNTIPVDIHVASPPAARILLLQVYAATLAILLFFYALHKRHLANRLTAFVHLSEKQRKEELDKLDYQDKLANLELKALSKQEKERELDLKDKQQDIILQREQLGLEKERLAVESARLDVEKKRAEYTLDLAIRLIDSLYSGGGSPEERAEILRTTLPALKDFGRAESNSTTAVMQVLEQTQLQPKAIPVTVLDAN